MPCAGPCGRHRVDWPLRRRRALARGGVFQLLRAAGRYGAGADGWPRRFGRPKRRRRNLCAGSRLPNWAPPRVSTDRTLCCAALATPPQRRRRRQPFQPSHWERGDDRHGTHVNTTKVLHATAASRPPSAACCAQRSEFCHGADRRTCQLHHFSTPMLYSISPAGGPVVARLWCSRRVASFQMTHVARARRLALPLRRCVPRRLSACGARQPGATDEAAICFSPSTLVATTRRAFCSTLRCAWRQRRQRRHPGCGLRAGRASCLVSILPQ